jgi:hypothetical protein
LFKHRCNPEAIIRNTLFIERAWSELHQGLAGQLTLLKWVTSKGGCIFVREELEVLNLINPQFLSKQDPEGLLFEPEQCSSNQKDFNLLDKVRLFISCNCMTVIRPERLIAKESFNYLTVCVDFRRPDSPTSSPLEQWFQRW